jgi:hypothetical protein
VKRSSADLVRSLRNIMRHSRDLLGVLNEEQVVITKVQLVHVEILRPQTKTPLSPPRHPTA